MIEKTKNFLWYIEDTCYDRICGAIANYANRNRDLLEDKLDEDARISSFKIDELDFKTMYIDDKVNSKIEFDVAVAADFDVYGCYGRHHDYDSYAVRDVWFLVSCSGIVGETFSDFRILCVNEFSKTKAKKPLSTEFVPVIHKEEYSDYAEEFLRLYYTEALKRPTKINVGILADNIGLTIK